MNQPTIRPSRIINSMAPIRIADNGGWTDTWFARHGKVFNIGVSPHAEVQVDVYPADVRDQRIVIHAENYGERYEVKAGADHLVKHPLLEAAIALMNIPEELAIEATIFSEVPAGASTGTSASVSVALIGALDRLVGGLLPPHEIAYAAHHVEMDILGLQCGIQDQLCAVYGGINLIEMEEFPRATVTQLRIPDPLWWELDRRLVLIYLGHAHSSSAVHAEVIRGLQAAGPENEIFDAFRSLAVRSRDALLASNLEALGHAMTENTETQRRLHRDLVSDEARSVIETAKKFGAVGWKVNGAGGGGGSLTILSGPGAYARRQMIREILERHPFVRNIPVRLSRQGLRVWESPGTP